MPWHVSIPTRNVSTHQKHAKGISLRYHPPRIGNPFAGIRLLLLEGEFS